MESDMRKLLIAVAIALACVSAARANDRSAETYYFACKSIRDLGAITRVAGRTNDDAFAKIAARVFPQNQCTMLTPGQRVTIERTNPRGQHCVRTAFDPQCFWTDEAAFHPRTQSR
jgi:hypothetical protein